MRRRLVATLGLAVLMLTAGCGADDPPPVDDVPALAERLDAVETAVAAERYAAARKAVAALVEDTTAAREAGDLNADQAEAILDTADALLAAFPGAEPEPEPEPEPETPPLELATPDLEPETTTAPPSEDVETAEPEDDDKPDKPDKPRQAGQGREGQGQGEGRRLTGVVLCASRWSSRRPARSSRGVP